MESGTQADELRNSHRMPNTFTEAACSNFSTDAESNVWESES